MYRNALKLLQKCNSHVIGSCLVIKNSKKAVPIEPCSHPNLNLLEPAFQMIGIHGIPESCEMRAYSTTSVTSAVQVPVFPSQPVPAGGMAFEP